MMVVIVNLFWPWIIYYAFIMSPLSCCLFLQTRRENHFGRPLLNLVQLCKSLSWGGVAKNYSIPDVEGGTMLSVLFLLYKQQHKIEKGPWMHLRGVPCTHTSPPLPEGSCFSVSPPPPWVSILKVEMAVSYVSSFLKCPFIYLFFSPFGI